jgi:probable HAF family extracellular repeat protein
MTDLGTLPGDVSSDADGINSKGQIVGGSFTATTSRAYLWQGGVMTDLNTLIPSSSPLYLLEATGTINSKGQIAGIALVISTGEVHAFLATPGNDKTADENAAAAVGGETTERPTITLPENVLKLLEQRRHFAGFKRGPIGLQ